MLVPLGLLAIGSIAAGYPALALFTGHGAEEFFRDLAEVRIRPTSCSKTRRNCRCCCRCVADRDDDRRLFGSVVVLYPASRYAGGAGASAGVLYQFLLNKWYFDEIYDFLFVRPALGLGRLFWKGGDGFIIDGLGPDGVSARVLDVTRNVIRLQTGYLYHYAFAMLIGVAGLITWFMFAGAHG